MQSHETPSRLGPLAHKRYLSPRPIFFAGVILARSLRSVRQAKSWN